MIKYAAPVLLLLTDHRSLFHMRFLILMNGTYGVLGHRDYGHRCQIQKATKLHGVKRVLLFGCFFEKDRYFKPNLKSQ